jgi:hypothetical protein
VVTSIQGTATPYIVNWKAPAVAGDGPWPEVTHSCMAVDSSFADPGVRLQQFAEAFGANGLVYSICETNFGPALNVIAMKVSQLLGPRCVPGRLKDGDGDLASGVCKRTAP